MAIELKYIRPSDPIDLPYYEVYENGSRVGVAIQEYHQGDYYWRYTYRGQSKGLHYDPEDIKRDFELYAESFAYDKTLKEIRDDGDDNIPF